MNSEIYGDYTNVAWGFVFLRNGETLASHPTQIYEALCYFALFAVLMWMYWKKNAQERPWLITGIFFIGIFLPRFLIEYIKNVQEPWELEMVENYGLNMGQVLSIPFVLLGVGMVVWAMTHKHQPFEYPGKYAEELEGKVIK
jgi:prolipoprotein diacylglyceryltransferase